MVLPSLASLLDLCSIRIAYLMWTRRDVARNCRQEELLTELENAVLADIQSLPLPERLQVRVLKYVRPAGERLLSLLNLWLSQLPCKTPQKWLIGYMLFDCLVLNADGLINQRKTAQTLVVSRVLHNKFAFRLACINFLENEVLKLWIYVKEYFLNKIILESQQYLQFLENFSNLIELLKKVSTLPGSLVDFYERRATNPSSLTGATESEEVLFWISYCLSKENGTDIQEVPHFKGNDVDWYRSLLQSAAFSGNVACFDYFKNYCKRKSKYDPVDIIKRIFESEEKGDQPSFIFNFMLLNFEEKTKLFQEFPMNMMSHFLQWPLSQTFLENTEEVWNLIPNEKKESAFEKVSAILVHENILLNPFDYEHREYTFDKDSNDMSTEAYCVEHITEIWIALWNKHSDSYKTTFLESLVFLDFAYVDSDDSDGNYEEFPPKFETSGLKQKLLDLFLSNGEALLELFEGENVKKSLRSLVIKYMPNDFQNLDRNCISFLKTNILQWGRLKKIPVRRMTPRILKYPCNPVDENYLNYIKTILFSYRN